MGLLEYILNGEIGELVECDKCDHNWSISKEDDNPYFCHNCGWDQSMNKYRSKDLENWLYKQNEQ